LVLKHAKGTSKSFDGGTRSLDRGKVHGNGAHLLNRSTDAVRDKETNDSWKGDMDERTNDSAVSNADEKSNETTIITQLRQFLVSYMICCKKRSFL